MENEFKRLKEIRAKAIDAWEKSGFLDGLKGHVKPEIAQLYECCKTAKLDDSMLPLSIKIITELNPDQEIVGTIKRIKEE